MDPSRRLLQYHQHRIGPRLRPLDRPGDCSRLEVKTSDRPVVGMMTVLGPRIGVYPRSPPFHDTGGALEPDASDDHNHTSDPMARYHCALLSLPPHACT